MLLENYTTFNSLDFLDSSIFMDSIGFIDSVDYRINYKLYTHLYNFL